ncbi:MAG: hypothetical protein IPO69_22050 [Saprospiraceae bacterium]|nr:hypothetical protein [Saprospiraceae bacterium]
MTQFNIDLHCHPSIKPYGKSFNRTAGENSKDKSRRNSIWYYDPHRAWTRSSRNLPS